MSYYQKNKLLLMEKIYVFKFRIKLATKFNSIRRNQIRLAIQKQTTNEQKNLFIKYIKEGLNVFDTPDIEILETMIEATNVHEPQNVIQYCKTASKNKKLQRNYKPLYKLFNNLYILPNNFIPENHLINIEEELNFSSNKFS